MINKNVNLELDAVKLVFDSYRTAGVIVAERILFGKVFENKDLPVGDSLLDAENLEGSINESFDIDDTHGGSDCDDILYFKKCIVAYIISNYSLQLARQGNSNGLHQDLDESVKNRLAEILKKYPQCSEYDVDKLTLLAKKCAEQLFDICSISNCIDGVANILQTNFLSDNQKKEEIKKIVSEVKPRLYVDYKPTLSFLSEHFASMEEFYIFDMEYYEDYPTFWFS